MTEERKNSAEEVQIIGETPQEVVKKRKEKKSLIGKIWDGVCWTSRKIWEHKETVATGIAVYGITKAYDKVEKAKAVDKAWNVGCTTGRISGKVEFNNSLTESEKDGWYRERNLSRPAFRNDDKLGQLEVEAIKARRNA